MTIYNLFSETALFYVISLLHLQYGNNVFSISADIHFYLHKIPEAHYSTFKSACLSFPIPLLQFLFLNDVVRWLRLIL